MWHSLQRRRGCRVIKGTIRSAGRVCERKNSRQKADHVQSNEGSGKQGKKSPKSSSNVERGRVTRRVGGVISHLIGESVKTSARQGGEGVFFDDVPNIRTFRQPKPGSGTTGVL